MSSNTGASTSGAPAAVSGSTYGAIHASASDLWMIRLPNRLASAWEGAPEGTVLGTLTFTKGGGGGGGPPSKRPKVNAPSSSKISITIDSKMAETQSDLPTDYTLEAMTKKTAGTLHPFTRHGDGGVAIHGVVSRSATAQVASGGASALTATSNNTKSNGKQPVDANTTRYRTLLKNRLLDTSVNSKRFVLPGGVDAASTGTGPLAAAKAAASLGTGFGGSVAKFGKRILDAKERGGLGGAGAIGALESQATGPVITGIENVRSTLFEFFSKKQLWTVRELRLASGGRLSERETREVLREIAEYHRTGEHKNMWELKAEFRSAAIASKTSNSGGGDKGLEKDRSGDDEDED